MQDESELCVLEIATSSRVFDDKDVACCTQTSPALPQFPGEADWGEAGELDSPNEGDGMTGADNSNDEANGCLNGQHRYR